MPERLAHALLRAGGIADQRWADLNKGSRAALRQLLCAHVIRPSGTLGWKKAEVMLGGIDTRELDSKTMESKQHPGLYFIGECVDVTGHLGGHNFQWAWSSGWAAAQAIASKHPAE
jgi:predicted flavoprotein YhiN